MGEEGGEVGSKKMRLAVKGKHAYYHHLCGSHVPIKGRCGWKGLGAQRVEAKGCTGVQCCACLLRRYCTCGRLPDAMMRGMLLRRS